MNQSEFEANTCNRRQARENACDQVMIDFGLNENDIFSVSDTGILGKRNSEFSQQESNLRPLN